MAEQESLLGICKRHKLQRRLPNPEEDGRAGRVLPALVKVLVVDPGEWALVDVGRLSHEGLEMPEPPDGAIGRVECRAE